MAWDFAAQIHALTGYDADDNSGTTETGETFSDMATQWLTDAAKEVIHLLPPNLKQKCAQIVVLNNTATTLDLDAMGEILQVTRENADSGYQTPCRKIPAVYGGTASDSTNMMHYATATDPVYWTTSNDSDEALLFIKPDPTANQTANVYHIGYPSSVPFSANTISNFPDEAEYLVVLRAAITTAEYLLAIEEDVEIYGAIITTLKSQYKEGIQALKTGEIGALQQKGAG
tara:strand:- start:1879 stop:2568 length:690 start_codon:yes stop_codon:yes gene_type:complete